MGKLEKAPLPWYGTSRSWVVYLRFMLKKSKRSSRFDLRLRYSRGAERSKFGKRKVHRWARLSPRILTSAVPPLRNSRMALKKRRKNRSGGLTEKRGAWAKQSHKIRGTLGQHQATLLLTFVGLVYASVGLPRRLDSINTTPMTDSLAKHSRTCYSS